MSKISIISFLLNILLYIFISLPVLVIGHNKKIFSRKKNYILSICTATIIEIVLSLIIYNFPYSIFSIFTTTQGIINYSVFISKILFSTSSLIAVKILVPALLIHLHKNYKKIFFIHFSIIILFCILGFLFKKTVGFLFGFPLSDMVVCIIDFVILVKIFPSSFDTK